MQGKKPNSSYNYEVVEPALLTSFNYFVVVGRVSGTFPEF